MPLEYHASTEDGPRPVGRSVKRGFFGRCPRCGEGRIFGKFLKVNPTCGHCGLNLDGHRADDMPPYIVIMIVGHIVVPLMMFAEQTYDWSMGLHAIVWMTLTLVLTFGLIQPVKGALIGYQWALKMHGFDPEETHPDPALPAPIRD
jgi:uncharacterized protein (DUF983 family)